MYQETKEIFVHFLHNQSMELKLYRAISKRDEKKKINDKKKIKLRMEDYNVNLNYFQCIYVY